MFPMDKKNHDDVTFQVTVEHLVLSSPLTNKNIHVTICMDGISKITCSGKQSKDGHLVTWNHPFLFTASLSAIAIVAIFDLPEELTPQWSKQPLGDQVTTSVATLLESGNTWKCDITGLSIGSATFSMVCRTSPILSAPQGHDCQSILGIYGTKLYDFGIYSKNTSFMSTSIEMNLARLDLCPLGHSNHVMILGSLGNALFIHHRQDGSITDLNRAIEVHTTRLNLCPLGHTEHPRALQWFTMSLWKHCCIQESKEDLNKVIEMQKSLLDLYPYGHVKHARALGDYAKYLWERYNRQGDIADLDGAIEMEEQRLDLCPAGHPDNGIALSNLAGSLSKRYQKQGNIMDLNKVIVFREQYLKLCPPNHLYHGTALHNLALSLGDHYISAQNLSDLKRAIKLCKEALDTYQVHHPDFGTMVHSLAFAILLPFHLSRLSPPDELPSLNDAFETYSLLGKCGLVASLSSLKAVQAWIKDAEKYSHSSALDAYQTGLNMLDHFTSLNSSLNSRHETMQARVADLANNAFSCATSYHDLQKAVEFLEQGRGILWNQLARFDISIAILESHSQGRELAKKFTRLSSDLKKHAQGSGDESTESYWRVQEQWQAVVAKIRTLDGFSRFLLPPLFGDLRRVAEHGPVIIVNASKYNCEAVIVLRVLAPLRVSLPCSLADVKALCAQLSELTQDVHAYGENRESWVKEMLRELWSSVVQPIAAVLQNEVQLASGSRVWWCPTSQFTTLPLHAAGPYRKGQKNFMDLYVSSYAPSLSGLIRTRERVCSQREARTAAGVPHAPISFAAVDQARPSANVNLSELVEVEHEIRRIRHETGMSPDVAFETVTGEAATIEGAVQAFRSHRWVHVACHGAQHATKPFDSWFAMGDGQLTLMRIIQERYTDSEFAFLSACHTAVGDASTPDEVLHLAAGLQFAGFNGVIGTLWRVDDAVAHRFVTRFYQEMFKHPNINFEHAAAALNTAAVETADEVSLEKRIVFVHIGI